MNIYTKLFYSGTALLGVLYLSLPSQSFAMESGAADSGEAKASAAPRKVHHMPDLTQLSQKDFEEETWVYLRALTKVSNQLRNYVATTENDKNALKEYRQIDADYKVAEDMAENDNALLSAKKMRALRRNSVRKSISPAFEELHRVEDEIRKLVSKANTEDLRRADLRAAEIKAAAASPAGASSAPLSKIEGAKVNLRPEKGKSRQGDKRRARLRAQAKARAKK